MTFYDVTETIQIPDPDPNNIGQFIPLSVAADGITDDSDNLQTMIDYVNSQGGGTLIFPGNRVVLISKQIEIYQNMTFKSSFGRATIKCIAPKLDNIFHCWANANYITIQGLEFDGNNEKQRQGIALNAGGFINIVNCVFTNMIPFIDNNGNLISSTFITLRDITNINVRDCVFKNSIAGGISVNGISAHIRIVNNDFRNLNRHAIHLQGLKTETETYYCRDVIIRGNYILINQQPSNEPGVHGIYMTCGDNQFDGTSSHHENVVVADNTIIGRNLSFPGQGGTADLFSLKDIIRLKCYGNTARGSGDLGFAIERCHYGIVSNNTADQNNRCGISIFGSSHMSVIGNVCGNNEQDHDNGSGSHPYGGIRVEFDSKHIVLSGNYLYGENIPDTGDPLLYENQQQYGIVVKETDLTPIVLNNPLRSPHNIKIGVNHYVNHSLGDIYDAVSSTIIEDSSANVITP